MIFFSGFEKILTKDGAQESRLKVTQKEELKQYYKDKNIAQKYLDKRFTFPLGRVLHEKQVSIVNKYLQILQPTSILEVACGPGRITLDVEVPSKVEAIAVDASEEMLAIAQRRAKETGKNQWRFLLEDAFSLDLKRKFDLIFSFRFVRHFKIQERRKIYDVIKKHLNTKGVFIFDVVNKEVSLPLRLKEGLENYPVYDELYTRLDFISEMQEEGFLIKELVPVHPYYSLMQKIQIYLGPRAEGLTYKILKFMEFNLKGRNLEWIAVCQLA